MPLMYNSYSFFYTFA